MANVKGKSKYATYQETLQRGWKKTREAVAEDGTEIKDTVAGQ
jgi:hypothetical protein